MSDGDNNMFKYRRKSDCEKYGNETNYKCYELWHTANRHTADNILKVFKERCNIADYGGQNLNSGDISPQFES